MNTRTTWDEIRPAAPTAGRRRGYTARAGPCGLRSRSGPWGEKCSRPAGSAHGWSVVLPSGGQ
jgi:hypothetical protein